MLSPLDLILRLFTALLLGGAIGLERERQERAAGLRTVTMVSLGSCLFTLLSLYGFGALADPGAPVNLRADPSRVAAQIVTGIGFLGAGTIFLRKDLVRGLTTAATIWATAAIGMAAGAGQYFAAAVTTLLVLIVLMVLKPMERRLFKRRVEATVSLLFRRSDAGLEGLRQALLRVGAIPQSIRLQEMSETEDRLELQVELAPGCTTEQLLAQVRGLPGAHHVLIIQEFSEDRARLAT